MQLIGANNVLSYTKRNYSLKRPNKKSIITKLASQNDSLCGRRRILETEKKKIFKTSRFVQTDEGLKIDFSGDYGARLIEEIKNYALVLK